MALDPPTEANFPWNCSKCGIKMYALAGRNFFCPKTGKHDPVGNYHPTREQQAHE
jgi:hypothetical protein